MKVSPRTNRFTGETIYLEYKETDDNEVPVVELFADYAEIENIILMPKIHLHSLFTTYWGLIRG
ncbi:MAG: hypothetical protein ABI472_00900 [Ginsengibacter sp.]